MLIFAPSCVAFALCSLAFADEVRIEAMRCSREVHLAAQNARLSTILERLAEKLRLEVHFESAGDPLISMDSHRSVDDLLVLLAPSKSISMTVMHDPNCRDQQRILEIWVLPKGHEDGAPRAVAAQAIPPQGPFTAQEGEALYLKAHGIIPERPETLQ